LLVEDSREVRIPIAIGTESPKVGKTEVGIPIAIGTESPKVEKTEVGIPIAIGTPKSESLEDGKLGSWEDRMNIVQEKLSCTKKSTKNLLHAYRGR